MGIGEDERAIAMTLDFPGADESRMKSHCLLFENRVRC